MIKTALATSIGICALCYQSSGSLAQSSLGAQNSFFPVRFDSFVPCADNGAGEVVELSGTIHDLFQLTSNPNGGGHLKILDNPQGVSGIGLTTGDKYHAVGVTQEEDTVSAGVQDTVINTFSLIGQGTGNNLRVHDNFHFTINANGEVISFHDNFSISCQ